MYLERDFPAAAAEAAPTSSCRMLGSREAMPVVREQPNRLVWIREMVPGEAFRTL